MKKIIIATIVWFLTMGIVSHAQETTTIVPEHFRKLSPGNKNIAQSYMPMFCTSQEPFLSELGDKFGESLVFSSLATNAFGETLKHQLWMNPESETWSFLVLNDERDTLCILASGEGLEGLKAKGIAL